jgi:hypothetical protein
MNIELTSEQLTALAEARKTLISATSDDTSLAVTTLQEIINEGYEELPQVPDGPVMFLDVYGKSKTPCIKRDGRLFRNSNDVFSFAEVDANTYHRILPVHSKITEKEFNDAVGAANKGMAFTLSDRIRAAFEHIGVEIGYEDGEEWL